MTRRCLRFLLSTALVLSPSAARAASTPAPPGEQEWASDAANPAVDTRWSVAPMLGFSTGGLSLGLGLRAGKTLSNRVYVGGTFVYNTGGATTAYPYSGYAGYPYDEPQYTGFSSTTSWSLFYTGPEGGYDFYVKHLVLRPYVGLGLAQVSVSYSTAGTVPTGVPVAAAGSASATGFAFWPGLTALYDIPHSMFFVGGDLRLLLSAGGDVQGVAHDAAVGFFATGGAKFTL